MNIFKILSSGDGSIKEPNVSAFLGYLLDPNKEHGLKDFLLRKVIEPIVSEDEPLGLLINGNIVNLTNDSDFKIEVELEKKVIISSGNKRDIDIVISIFEKTELKFILCIENKIRASSVTKNQLNEQLEGIKKEFPETQIGFIYLTPESCPKCKEEYCEFKTKHENIPATHLFWSSDIYDWMIDMLVEESKGEIEPIFEYSKYTIKAFMNFIQTDFQSYKDEKRNINKRDNTKYNFNGLTNLTKGKVVLAVVKKYIQDNPETTYNQAKDIFTDKINTGFILTLEEEKERIDKRKRHFMKDDERITLKDNRVIVVRQGWSLGKGNKQDTFDRFLNLCKKLNYNISES